MFAPEVTPNSPGEPLAGHYFVPVYPPISAWRSGPVSALQYVLNEPRGESPLGLDVHIPFCQKKCDYCHCVSFTGQTIATVNRYLETVVRELELFSEHAALQDRKLSFVRFCGGTPSTLTTAQVEFLTEGLHGILDWSSVEEITFDVAPRSVRPELLRVLRELGVNRISMGVESFDDGVLKTNGRIHLSRDVRHAYELIREYGFECVDLALMCGLMAEGADQWRYTLNETIKLNPESVTIRQMEIAPNTQLYRDLKANRLRAKPPTWETKRARLFYGFDALERAGYHVISAYTAVKKPETQRPKYEDHVWFGADVLGLGVASFGYLDGVQYQTHLTLEEYMSSIDAGQLPILRAYSLTDWQQLVREFVLQLKFGELDAKHFYGKFGIDVTDVFAAQLTELASEGFLVFSKCGVRLTRAGLLRVDRIIPRFFDPEFRGAQTIC